ncbi:ferritin family protein [Paenibacillus puerhi]|uniref:ferritin family protein n=1 Tax=Paenibacillus puerhi TaxID=2692622 RepID=UPI001F4013A5|nr:ferritin-like domain-containing protein [Paenibacillus puerhi]
MYHYRYAMQRPVYSVVPPGPYGNMRQQPTTYKSLEEAIALIREALAGEKEDELFYDYLISVAPSQEDKEILTSIRDDERKHNQMFRKLYQTLTGQTIAEAKDVKFEKPKSYTDGLRKAFFGELEAVERYRDIRAGLQERYNRDMLFEIITDEQKHASKLNYLLNLDLRRRPKK